jgi:hypothetical protein
VAKPITTPREPFTRRNANGPEAAAAAVAAAAAAVAVAAAAAAPAAWGLELVASAPVGALPTESLNVSTICAPIW